MCVSVCVCVLFFARICERVCVCGCVYMTAYGSVGVSLWVLAYNLVRLTKPSQI